MGAHLFNLVPGSRRGLLAALLLALGGADAAGKRRKGRRKKRKKHPAAGCTPNCNDRTCGSDGCGGSCGSCVVPQTCRGGTCLCIPDCRGRNCGDDGCGDSCGPCDFPRTCQDGLCLCREDLEECGGTCVVGCVAPFILSPATCGCCLQNGTVIEASQPTAQCCSRFTVPATGPRTCTGRASGQFCAFDAQCASGTCIGGTCT